MLLKKQNKLLENQDFRLATSQPQGHRTSTSALEEARGNPTASLKGYLIHDDGAYTGCTSDGFCFAL